MTSEELKTIYASAPVSSTNFEVITLTAPWYTKDYHLQNIFTEGIDVVLETSETVTADFAPMALGQSGSNADLNDERTIVIQLVNDIIASEQERFDPEIHNPDDQKIQFRGYIYYRTGEVSSLQTSVLTVTIRDITRDSETGASSIRVSSKPANETATGELCTVTRVPMLRGFL